MPSLGNRSLTPQTEAAIVKRLRGGESVTFIARQVRVRRPDVSRVARQNKISVRRGRPPRSANRFSCRQRVIDMFQLLREREHLDSIRQVADLTGVSRQYVAVVLARADIPAPQIIADCLLHRDPAALRLRTAGPPPLFCRMMAKSETVVLLPLPRLISAC